MRDSDNYILDSTAFYAGLQFRIGSFYTTSKVIEEIKHIKSYLTEVIIENKISIIDPEPYYVNKAKEEAIKNGDIVNLSDTDISVIALALKLKGSKVITSDYSIINLLRSIGIDVIGKDIKIGRWLVYCSVCKIKYPPYKRSCYVCGNRLRRKLITNQSENKVKYFIVDKI